MGFVLVLLFWPSPEFLSVGKKMQETQEMQVRSMSWEDLLEKKMATHSSIFAWKSHGERSPAGYSLKGSQRLRNNWETKRTHRQCCQPTLLASPLHRPRWGRTLSPSLGFSWASFVGSAHAPVGPWCQDVLVEKLLECLIYKGDLIPKAGLGRCDT